MHRLRQTSCTTGALASCIICSRPLFTSTHATFAVLRKPERTGKARATKRGLCRTRPSLVLFNETLKRRLDAYCAHTSGFRLTRRARKRFGRYADHVVLSKKQPANMRADEADALLMALPTALEQLLYEFEEPLLKKGWTRPLAEDPTAKIIAAVAALLQWYVRIRKPFIAANDLLRLQDALESALGHVKNALPKKSGQSEENAYNFPKFHQVIRSLFKHFIH